MQEHNGFKVAGVKILPVVLRQSTAAAVIRIESQHVSRNLGALSMMSAMTPCRRLAVIALLPLALSACTRQRYIETTIRNESGGELRTVEVDYPGGSFGTTRLSVGQTFRYRFKPLHTGASKLLYVENGKEYSFNGPDLKEAVGGVMSIEIRPANTPQRVMWIYTAEVK